MVIITILWPQEPIIVRIILNVTEVERYLFLLLCHHEPSHLLGPEWARAQDEAINKTKLISTAFANNCGDSLKVLKSSPPAKK